MNYPVKRLVKALLVLALFFCGGCSSKSVSHQKQSALSQDQQLKKLVKQQRQLYLWSVYWDNETSLASVYKYAKQVSGIGDFAAYYSKQDRLFLPTASQELVARVRKSSLAKLPVYLSVVNDRPNDPKSTKLLQRLLKTAASSKAAAKEIVQLANKHGFAGVELDFENIRNDLALWQKFIPFEEELQSLCRKRGLKLRVVLESSTPKAVKLPPGPDYVVMCYNLHYSGTKPGPKADKAFLTQVAKKFKDLSNVSYALANGGFDFKGKQATALKSSQIAELLRDKQATPRRDAESGAMHFKAGLHEVWYADGTTLAEWAKTLDQAAGHKVAISLWRLE